MIGSVYINYKVAVVDLGFSYSNFSAGAVGAMFHHTAKQTKKITNPEDKLEIKTNAILPR